MATPIPQPSTESSRPSVIYILGAPGAGKGTLCKLLAATFTNVYHLSVGDHLRHLQTQDSSASTSERFGGLDHGTFSEQMQQRRLLPDETIVAIVDAALKAVSNTAFVSGVSNPIVLVDGFPRSLRSAELADVPRAGQRAFSSSIVLVSWPRLVSWSAHGRQTTAWTFSGSDTRSSKG